jgi:hypothetical protein
MNPPANPPAVRLPRAMLVLSCAAAVLLGGAAQAAAEVKYHHESEQEWKSQVDSGQVARVEINRRVRSLRTTLKDGRYVLAHYPKGQTKQVKEELREKHVPVTVLTTKQSTATGEKHAVHHKLRYIVGGIVIAVIVIVAAAILIRRRRVGVD